VHLLWDELMEFLRPKVLLASGALTLKVMVTNLNRADYGAVDAQLYSLSDEYDLSWDEVIYYHPFRPIIHAFVLPQFEHTPFVSSTECAPGVQRLARRIAKALSEPPDQRCVRLERLSPE